MFIWAICLDERFCPSRKCSRLKSAEVLPSYSLVVQVTDCKQWACAWGSPHMTSHFCALQSLNNNVGLGLILIWDDRLISGKVFCCYYCCCCEWFCFYDYSSICAPPFPTWKSLFRADAAGFPTSHPPPPHLFLGKLWIYVHHSSFHISRSIRTTVIKTFEKSMQGQLRYLIVQYHPINNVLITSFVDEFNVRIFQ